MSVFLRFGVAIVGAWMLSGCSSTHDDPTLVGIARDLDAVSRIDVTIHPDQPTVIRADGVALAAGAVSSARWSRQLSDADLLRVIAGSLTKSSDITLGSDTEPTSVLRIVVGPEADRVRDAVPPVVSVQLPVTVPATGAFTFAVLASEALHAQSRPPTTRNCWIESFDPVTRQGTARVAAAVGDQVTLTLPARWGRDLAGNWQADPVIAQAAVVP
jgi:hypothetical protein